MGQKLTIKKDSSYFITLTVVNWVDAFTRKNHKEAVVESLRYCIKHKGLNVYAWCLMTNYLHMIVNTCNDFQLKDVIRDFKKFTSKKILKQIQYEPESRREWMLSLFGMEAVKITKHKNYKFWKSGNHAIELYGEKFVWDKINYIHKNPVEEGFVENPEDWKYSSASNYANKKAVLEEVYCLPGRLITY